MLQIRSEQKEKISEIEFPEIDFGFYSNWVENEINKSVVSRTISRLSQNTELSNWVYEGLNIHKKIDKNNCQFCGQVLPSDTLDEIENYFNKEYKDYISNLANMHLEVSKEIQNLKETTLPVVESFYPAIKELYSATATHYNSARDDEIKFLEYLLALIENKQNNPFVSNELTLLHFDNQIAEYSKEIRSYINKNNEITAQFLKEKNKYRAIIEDHIVGENIQEYERMDNKIKNKKQELKNLNLRKSQLITKINELDRQLLEHFKPAEEINNDLISYLGHSNIKFVARDKGYEIQCNGKIAKRLSEGEKTAIAFTYFLKSLNDVNFDIHNSIVIIDDPISSLDSNALYHAFAFLKSRTDNVKQLFVLTHNFSFFRQVKKWFNASDKKGKSNYYMFTCQSSSCDRRINISILDKLLLNYESDYHYLFKLVYENSNASKNDLEYFYYLPNVARRFLESFLAFRYPNKSNLTKKIENLKFDESKKVKLLRFLHTYSHNDFINDQQDHDTSILSETPTVLNHLLELVKSEDLHHYKQLEYLISN